jgi:hypothetical protein
MSNAVEMKVTASARDEQQALIQLCCYARQILREQLDRRFLIGLTLCLDKLNVYLFDRSGVVGMEKSIDIHKVMITRLC